MSKKFNKSEAKKLYKDFYSQRLLPATVISSCVGNNTIRAYSTKTGNKPLNVFRNWATNFTQKILDKKLKFKDYMDLHSNAIKNLSKYWKKKTNIDLFTKKPHLIYKLVDLYFKRLPLMIGLDAKTKKLIKENCTPPLDKHFYNQFKKDFKDYKRESLKSMGDWPKNGKYKTYVEWYIRVNEDIRELSRIPIMYELFAWDSKE